MRERPAGSLDQAWPGYGRTASKQVADTIDIDDQACPQRDHAGPATSHGDQHEPEYRLLSCRV